MHWYCRECLRHIISLPDGLHSDLGLVTLVTEVGQISYNNERMRHLNQLELLQGHGQCQTWIIRTCTHFQPIVKWLLVTFMIILNLELTHGLS